MPRPDIPVAEGLGRDLLREELRQLAAQELRATHQAWDPFFAKYQKPLEPGERDQAAWEFQRTLDLLRRLAIKTQVHPGMLMKTQGRGNWA